MIVHWGCHIQSESGLTINKFFYQDYSICWIICTFICRLCDNFLHKEGVHSRYWSIFIILMHLMYNISLKNTLLVDFHYFNVPNVQYLCNARTVLVPYNCAQLDPKCKQREKSERGLDESL